MIARLNKIPFFLWFTKSVNIEKIDDEKVKIDGKLSYLTEVSREKIFLLKYLFLLLFLIANFNLYNFTILSVLLGTLLMIFTVFILKFLKSYFLVYSIFFSALCFLGIYIYDLEQLIEKILYISIYFSFIVFLIYDLKRLFSKKDIYYFTSLTKNININSKQKIPQILPKFIKEFKEKKINFLNLDTVGFYIKISKDKEC